MFDLYGFEGIAFQQEEPEDFDIVSDSHNFLMGQDGELSSEEEDRYRFQDI